MATLRHFTDLSAISPASLRAILDDAAARKTRIKAGEQTHVPRLKSKESKDTTHVCAVDRNGACATMTHTPAAAQNQTPSRGFLGFPGSSLVIA